MMTQQRTICAIWAFAIYLGFLTGVHADEPLYLRGTELTSQLEIVPSTLRKSIRNNEFLFDLTVTNQSNQDYQGPLALVIERTGVESLLPKKFDHLFSDDGQGFLDLVESTQTLKAGATLKLRRVRLMSKQDLAGDPADQFSLVARIYTLKNAEQGVAAESASSGQQIVQGRGLPGGIPFRLPEQATGQGNSQSDGGLKPVPDPIGDTGEGQQVADTEPESSQTRQDAPPNRKRRRQPTDQELESALKAKNAWVDKLFDIDGVHSVGRSWGTEGNAVVMVKVQNFDQKKNIPSQLDGVPVEVYVAPQTKLFDRRGQIGYWREPGLCENGDPRAFYERPIRVGVSGWNANILECATGTIGCRLENPTTPSEKYILSNSHVFADRGLGTAAVGDPIVQPGPYDFSCAIPPMGDVGNLDTWSTYNLTGNNTIDAAVATTSVVLVGTSTPCNGYGVPSETTVTAVIGMEVMKYGRTTSFTTGVVLSDSVTSNVFDGVNLVTFINQVEIVGDISTPLFSDSGDSGSLIVTRSGRNPVALLFAGSIFSTLGNPIDAVLSAMGGLRVDGQP